MENARLRTGFDHRLFPRQHAELSKSPIKLFHAQLSEAMHRIHEMHEGVQNYCQKSKSREGHRDHVKIAVRFLTTAHSARWNAFSAFGLPTDLYPSETLRGAPASTSGGPVRSLVQSFLAIQHKPARRVR
jgi:hypothetical protein